jgi:hypothetical protein
MTGIRRRSRKNRIWRSVRCLKASCHFSRVRRIHPALCIADMLCDTTGFGLQCNYSVEIDEPALIAAANLCDETVLLADGTSEPRYSCNGNITSDTAPGEILSMMPSSLSHKDLMAPIKWMPNRKYRDKVNGVRATFIFPTYPYVNFGLPYGQKTTGIFDACGVRQIALPTCRMSRTATHPMPTTSPI